MPLCPADAVVSVTSSDGTTFDQVAVADGVQAWQDSDFGLTAVPERLLGGTLLRGPHAALARGAGLAVRVVGADARVYAAVEISRPNRAAPRNGGLAVALANAPRWINEEGVPAYGDGNSELTMFSTIAAGGATTTLPETTEAGAVFLLIVVPVVTGSFAVSVVSSSGTPQQERLAVVQEGVVAWRDRDHRYTHVPRCLLGGALYQGPHKDVPEGCVLSVRPNLQSRIYVVTERASNGGFVDNLPLKGWTMEDEAPRWHDMPTMVMFSRDCAAGSALTLPPTRGSGTVFSIIVVPSTNVLFAPVEVSCCAAAGSAAAEGDAAASSTAAPLLLSLVPMADGTPLWPDSSGRRLAQVPEWMCGSTLVRCSASRPPAGALLTVRAAAPSVIYAIVEAEGTGAAGGLVSALLAAGWERRDEAPQLAEGPALAVYARRTLARQAISLPQLPGAPAMAALAVKVDVEAFDAGVETSRGVQYHRTTMEETVVAWSDRPHRFAWVPDYILRGLLFRGPHDSTPAGTTMRVRASGAFRAYVIVEAKYAKGKGRSGGFLESLPAACWRKEAGGPSWGDTASTMEIYSRRAAEGEDLLLPATTGEVVFSIVVVDISNGAERIAEELKHSFRSWDVDGKGAISKEDLDQVMRALCPGLSDEGREALLAHADRAGTGRIDYQEFADSLLLAA